MTAGATTTQNFNLRWLEPCVAAAPTAMEVTLTQGYSTTLTLDLANGGAISTSFQLTELPGPTVLKAPERQVVIGDMDFGRNPNPARAATPFTLAPLAPNAVTLTHSQSQTIVANNSAACGSGGIHADNSYIRKFDLEAFGITGSFAVTNVQVGIETAAGAGGTQPATVNLYTWDPADDFTFANFTLIGTADTDVDDQDLSIIDVPSRCCPGRFLPAVEFFTPDGQTAGNGLYVVRMTSARPMRPTWPRRLWRFRPDRYGALASRHAPGRERDRQHRWRFGWYPGSPKTRSMAP